MQSSRKRGRGGGKERASLIHDRLDALQKSAKSDSQKIAYTIADVSTFEGARQAIETSMNITSSSSSSSHSVGRIPDTIFCCAGASKPGFFIEQTEEDFQSGFKTIYMTALSTSHVSVLCSAHYMTRSILLTVVHFTLARPLPSSLSKRANGMARLSWSAPPWV